MLQGVLILSLAGNLNSLISKNGFHSNPSDIIAVMSKNHKIAILSDTHVGDRVSQLNPALFSALQDEKPDQILHAGDVCTPEAIAQLETIAPTLVVQGNRDWFLGYKPPKDVHLEIHGLKIALAHGHFSIWHWFWNYVHLFLTRKGQDHRFYQEKLARYYPDADVIVFGHLHYPYREVRDGKLYLNPGAGYPEWRNNYRPGYMILDIKPDGSYTTVLKYTNPQAD